MKTITKYVAHDNAEFSTEAECIAYEKLSADVAAIMANLEPLPVEPNCNFANGDGYIQQSQIAVLSAREAILRFADWIHPHRWLSQSIVDYTIDPSWAGRIIGECCPRPLVKAWHRIECIDSEYREWGQGYFCAHQNEAKRYCRNPPRGAEFTEAR